MINDANEELRSNCFQFGVSRQSVLPLKALEFECEP
jgi:hypothetical protein